MNEYDSARMQDLLNDSHGFETTENEEEAEPDTAKYLLNKRKSSRKGIPSIGQMEKVKR